MYLIQVSFEIYTAKGLKMNTPKYILILLDYLLEKYKSVFILKRNLFQ